MMMKAKVKLLIIMYTQVSIFGTSFGTNNHIIFKNILKKFSRKEKCK